MNDLKSIKKAIKILKKIKLNMQYFTQQTFIPPHNLIRLNALIEIKKIPKTVYGLSDHTGKIIPLLLQLQWVHQL